MRAHQLKHPVGVIGFHARPPDAENKMVDAEPVTMSLNLLNHVVYAAQDKTVMGLRLQTERETTPGPAWPCPGPNRRRPDIGVRDTVGPR